MFSLSVTDRSMHAEISASLENVDRLCGEVRQMMDRAGHEADHFSAQLILREALNNAVIHGCGKDPLKLIESTLEIRDNCLLVEISDPGEGFDWKEEMTKVKDDAASSGRGLGIFSAYASGFSYNDKGSSLYIKMNLG